MYSLFEWTTPERRSAHRVLPIVPNEIYFHVFEHVAPPSGPLTSEELRLFANLSVVCRLFANVCLPRVFEFLEFSGAPFRYNTSSKHHGHALVIGASREDTLCTQIVEKQPLALALAKTVKVCRFTDWRFGEERSLVAQLLSEKYLVGVLHMSNIHEIKFSNCLMHSEHWNAIATLRSLETLSFDWCKFLRSPADASEPEKWRKVRVSHLRVVDCNHPLATPRSDFVVPIDPRNLRTLAMDIVLFEYVHWLPQSALTELYLYLHYRDWSLTQERYMERLHAILMQAPQSLEALSILINTSGGLSRDLVRKMFLDPALTNLSLLRSLTLRVPIKTSETPLDILSSALEGIGLTRLQSFTLQGGSITLAEVRRTLQGKLRPMSCLRYVDIHGQILRLVDGEWSEASSSTA